MFLAAHKEIGIVSGESLISKNAQHRQMEGQLNRPALGAATPLAELSILRANVSPLSCHFTVFIEVRHSMRPSSVDKVLGKTCVPYQETTTFLGQYIHLSLLYFNY